MSEELSREAVMRSVDRVGMDGQQDANPEIACNLQNHVGSRPARRTGSSGSTRGGRKGRRARRLYNLRNRSQSGLNRRWVRSVLSIVAVVVLLSTSLGTVRAQGTGGALPAGISGASNAYYPYVIPAGMFPAPDSAVPSTSGANVTLPQLGATGVGTDPTYFLVYVSANTSPCQTCKGGGNLTSFNFEIREGVFSAWMATDIVASNSSRTLPINWSVPYSIEESSVLDPYTPSEACTSTALVVAPDGSSMFAGVTCNGSTSIYRSSVADALTQWTSVTTLTGSQVRLALDPTGVALASTISSSGEAVATILPFPTGTVSSYTLGPAVQAGPLTLRTADGVLLAVLSVSSSGTETIWSLNFPGESFTAFSFLTLPSTGVSSTFNSLGSTRLGSPGGSADQLAAASLDANVLVICTVVENGTTEAAISSSADEGVFWNSPTALALPMGSMIDPELVASPDGYFTATWLATGGDNVSVVEEATLAPDGSVLSGPSAVPGGSGPLPVSESQGVGVALDSYQRPLLVWATPPGTATNSIAETGGFLSPSHVVSLAEQALGNLTSNDLASGSLSTFKSTVANLLGQAATNAAQGYVSTHLNAARNLTADAYQNVSVTGLSYVGEKSSGSGSSRTYTMAGGAVMTPAVETGSGYHPPYPAGSLVPSVGFGSASTYLNIESDWLLASEGVPPVALANPLDNVTLPLGDRNLANYGLPGVTSATVDGKTSSATVTPYVPDPTTAQLAISGSYPTYWYNTSSSTSAICFHRWIYPTRMDNYVDTPTTFNDTPTVNTVTLPRISQSSFISTLYLQNLSADGGVYWTLYLSAAYTEVDHWVTHSGCGVTYGNTTYGYAVVKGPATISMTTGASFSTTLSTSTSVNVNTKASSVSVAWSNSMLATANVALGPSLSTYSVTYGYSGFYTYTGAPSSGQTYTASVSTTSHTGFWDQYWQPSDSVGQQTSSPSQTAEDFCQFIYRPDSFKLWGLSSVSGADNTAAVTWDSNVSGLGILDYYEIGSGVNQTVTTTVAPVSGNYTYTAEIHGFSGGALYGLTATTTISDGACLSLSSSISSLSLLGQGFSVDPVAYPYDSISQTGGGEGVYSHLAAGLHTQLTQGKVQFTGGSLVYGPSSLAGPNVSIPISTLSSISCGVNCYLVNTTPSQPDSTYVVQETLNFSWNGGTYSLASSPTWFYYLQDSSGDGLTDAEKVSGWTVTSTNAQGTTTTALVTANEFAYATNGLVSDYVEKQFGLDPRTLDTAGSHMLDTWNLTFDLGPGSPTLPSSTFFHYFVENATYNFSKACQEYSAGTGGCPLSSDAGTLLSNLTATNPRNTGDSNPWAASVRWTGSGSGSALSQLESLITSEGVGWLRATAGYYEGDRTITVWGKLSWGANPLAQSTRDNGVADGNLADPLEAEVVQVNVSAWSATLNSASDAAAPYFELTSGSGGTGTLYYSGYGPAVGNAGTTVSYSGPYVATAPVSTTGQYVYLNLSLNDATGSGTVTLLTASMAVDLVGTGGGASFGGLNTAASLSSTVSVLRIGEKANTLLWAPGNNTTLSNLPWGLKRYAAEPDFNLLVLNLSSAVTVSGVAGAEGGYHYSIPLSSGLNNLLVPRGAFLASPLGQALINNTNETVSIPSNSGVSFHATDWSSRSETSGSNTPGSSNFIWVLSNQSQSQNGSSSGFYGGLPSNPTVESGLESLQVQAVFWVNVSSSGYEGLASGSAELADLFGGLVANSSGNLTGNILQVTPALGTLGFPRNVQNALANVSLRNDGAYSAPMYQQSQASTAWWQSAGAAVWNTVSGVALVTGFTKLVSVVWSSLQAAAAYIGEAAAAFSTLLGISKLANQFAATLKTITSAMEWALSTLWLIVKEEVLGYLSNPVHAVLGPDQPNSGIVTGLALASDPGGSTSNPQVIGDVAGGFAIALIPAFTLSSVIYICSSILVPFTAVFGPVAPIISVLILALLGVQAGTHRGGMNAQIGESAKSLLQAAASFVSGVVGNTSSAQQDITDLAVILGGIAWIGGIVVSLVTPGNALADNAAMGLGMIALVMAAFTPSANVTVFNAQVAGAGIFAGLALVATIVGAYLSELNWVAGLIAVALAAAAVYLVYGAAG